MSGNLLIAAVFIPLVVSIFVFFIKSRTRLVKEVLVILATALNVIFAFRLFGNEIRYSIPWVSFGVDFSLRLDRFAGFILAAAACFAFLVALYSAKFMENKEKTNQFYAYFLINIAFANGVILSDNLIVLLFFWEGLLLAMFGMIAIGNKNAIRTATKAFIIIGITDLCMMFGIGLTGHLAGTFNMSGINLELNRLGSIAFVFLIIGAISKGGSMPFHSWIPDAAVDAPLPFMALIPASFEKLLGIYFLTRISFYMFKLAPGAWVSVLLMIIGAITILLAVMMALVQKDFKKLLSYHAISQVGYMILGIGTAVPAGIVGGLFHMLNNAIYKNCLFLTGGAVEKQTGTTDLNKLGSLNIKMPVTFWCFVIAALSISGVPPFNGFFSKELIYDGALERGWIFYLAAVIGSFFTAASFLKLGHSAFLDKSDNENKDIKEAPFSMQIPMVLLAGACILFGLVNAIPVKMIMPVLGEEAAAGHHFYGMPSNILLVVITLVVLIGAFLNHRYGAKKTGKGLGAVDHIHYAPVLHDIYERAEKRDFDPYDIGLKLVDLVKKISWGIDRGIDYIYDVISVKSAYAFTFIIKKAHSGNYSLYIVWILLGLVFMMFYR